MLPWPSNDWRSEQQGLECLSPSAGTYDATSKTSRRSSVWADVQWQGKELVNPGMRQEEYLNYRGLGTLLRQCLSIMDYQRCCTAPCGSTSIICYILSWGFDEGVGHGSRFRANQPSIFHHSFLQKGLISMFYFLS